MAAEKATLTNSTAIQWADETLFDGYVLLIMALPSVSSASWTRVALKDTVPFLRLPTRIKVPIRQGFYDSATKVWRTDSLIPPGVKYAAFYYDSTNRLISVGGTLFTITTSEHALEVAAFTDPTASVTIPDPEDVPTSGTTLLIYGAPNREDLVGTKNGINTAFTISYAASVAMILWNGMALDEGVGYTRSGVNITMTTAPDSVDSLEAVLW